RRGERAHHLFLGTVVEHAAPGRLREPHQGAHHGGDHVRRHDLHGARRVVLQRGGVAAPRAYDHPRARAARRLGARAGADGGGMSWGGWSEFWAMGGYAFYVWGSYAVTAALVAAELALLRARRRSALAAPRGA